MNLQSFIDGLAIGQIRIIYGQPGSDVGFNIAPNFKKIDLVLPPPKFGDIDTSKLTTALLSWCTPGGGTGSGNVLYIPNQT